MPPVLGFIGTYNPNGTGGSIDNSLGVDQIFSIHTALPSTEIYNRTMLSVDQMAIANLDDGPYIGRTHLTNNLFSVENIGVAQPEHLNTAPFATLLYYPAISASGEFMIAAGASNTGADICVSYNWGVDWNACGLSEYFNGAGMSADGKIIIVTTAGDIGTGNQGILRSIDYGITFNTVYPSSDALTAPSMSIDGKYILVVSNSVGIYLSNDYGDTWTVIPDVENRVGSAVSSDGKIMLVTSYGGAGSLISYNYGATWILAGNAPAGPLYYGAFMSTTGKYMLMAAVGANATAGLYISNDYGQSWTHQAINPNRDFTHGSVSASGKTMTACSYTAPGGFYLSEDFGVTWNLFDAGVVGAWFTSTMSAGGNIILSSINATGLYIYRADTYISGNSINAQSLNLSTKFDELYPRSLLSVDQLSLVNLKDGPYFGRTRITNNLFSVVNIGVAEPYTVPIGVPPTGLPGVNLYWISVSATGRKIVVAQDGAGNRIYISEDYGYTWTVRGPARYWRGIGISADGNIIFAVTWGVGQSTHMSRDGGITWINLNFDSGSNGVALSADGRYIIWGGAGGLEGNRIHVSRDYGATWNVYPGGGSGFAGMSMSSDGKIMVANHYNNSVKISYDYGNTWSKAQAVVKAWYGSSMSANGKFILVSSANIASQLIVSNDYGNTWNSYGPNAIWSYVSVSQDGQTMVACSSTDVHISIDAGITWSLFVSAPLGSVFQPAMSADGNIVVVSESTGRLHIYKSDIYISSSNSIISLDKAAIADANMPNSTYVAWIDEGTDMLTLKVKYSDGTVKNVSIGPLA